MYNNNNNNNNNSSDLDVNSYDETFWGYIWQIRRPQSEFVGPLVDVVHIT
jgi:hypothetical protein